MKHVVSDILHRSSFFLHLISALQRNSRFSYEDNKMLCHRLCFSALIGLLIFVRTGSTDDVHSLKNLGAFCSNDSSLGVPNLNPIDDSPAKFVRTVENGSLYTIGTGDDQLWLLHVWGDSGYDYGFAYGTLLKEQIIQLIPRAWAHFEQRVIDELDQLKLPKWFVDLVASKGLAFALDFQNTLVEAYVDKEIYEEMRGIADAAQVNYASIRRLHMLGEITRGISSHSLRDPLGFFHLVRGE